VDALHDRRVVLAELDRVVDVKRVRLDFREPDKGRALAWTKIIASTLPAITWPAWPRPRCFMARLSSMIPRSSSGAMSMRSRKWRG